MARRKELTYEEKINKALGKIPNPLEDKKHRIYIAFVNDRARSNESRFDHISLERHSLKPRDIDRIVEHINESVLKKDRDRKNTFNLYIKRNNFGDEYIKISIEINFRKSNMACVKTMFITKNTK
jgi:gamma-glutamyl phosphate reductase